jgi:hypothetical protein
MGGFVCWLGRPGSGRPLVALLSVVPLVVREVRWLWVVLPEACPGHLMDQVEESGRLRRWHRGG